MAELVDRAAIEPVGGDEVVAGAHDGVEHQQLRRMARGHRKRRGSRGGRPVCLDAADYKGRNVIERRYCHIKQWRGLATRYDKLAITYRAAVILNAVIAWTRQLSDMP